MPDYISLRQVTRELIFPPGGPTPECHASTLVVLPDGTVVAAWFGGSHEKHPDVEIWSARRENGVWSQPRVLTRHEGVPCWNPVLFSGDEGELLLYYKVGPDVIHWRTWVMTSRDGGVTWSAGRELIPGDVGGRGPVKNKPIRLHDGTWLAPASVETSDRWDAHVDRSEDSGLTWTRCPVPLDHGTLSGKGIIQPALWESEQGVHMLLRSTEGCLFRSDSRDGGRTWSPARPTALPNNNSGIDVATLDSDVLLVYNPVTGNWAARTPIVLALSTDNGEHFTPILELDHDPLDDKAEFSYPAIVTVGCDIHITYTHRRKSIAYWHLTKV